MSEPSLPDKVVAIHERLTQARVPHAFGGALALAYYAEPRATIDIDLNIFVSPARHQAVRDALAPLGFGQDMDAAALERDGQCRLWWGRTPVDLFFAFDQIHVAMRRDTRRVPFGEGKLPILAPEHLIVCKAAFDRPKDWLDIEQILVCTEHLDIDETRRWLVRVVGEDDFRKQRFDELADATTTRSPN